MAIKTYKPTTPSRRAMTRSAFETITKSKPERSLTAPLKKKAGRNNRGVVTVRHQGGGHKRQYRIIDFKRDKFGIPARVEAIEYDPNRSARIALLVYADGERRYILAPRGVQAGVVLMNGAEAPIRPGNTLPIRNIPVGSTIHCIEMLPGKGAQIARSAGTSARLLAREGSYAQVRLRSGEIRRVHIECRATIGEVGNESHSLRTIGKAGANRWRGIRPTVRGIAMNPVDHPHGGRSNGGGHPVSPWGIQTKGFKTRTNKRSDTMIVQRRGRK